MKTEFKDVAHLYLPFMAKDSEGIEYTITGQQYPEMLLWESDDNEGDIDVSEIKPILRPLSDMTEEERAYCLECIDRNADTWIGGAQRTAYLLKQGFDLFNLLENGFAIDKTTPTKFTNGV